jgi:hypothetical protein
MTAKESTVSHKSAFGVRERDLQIVLARLFRSNWIGPRMITEIAPDLRSEDISRVECDIAIWDSTLGIQTERDRETDLAVRFAFAQNGAERSGLFLIEVKIVAPFGRGQVEDYCRRVDLLAGTADRVSSALMSPQAHLLRPGASRFGGWLTLERLHTVATEHCQFGEATRRLDHEVEIIAKSLSAAAAGYQPLVSLDRQQQFAFYDTFVDEYSPGLSVRPSGAGLRSLDRFFDIPLKFGVIKHRIEEGIVAIEFFRKGLPPDSVSNLARQDGLQVELTGSSTSWIYRQGGLIGLDVSKSFEAQESTLRQALDEVTWLHNWVDLNRPAFAGWAC